MTGHVGSRKHVVLTLFSKQRSTFCRLVVRERHSLESNLQTWKPPSLAFALFDTVGNACHNQDRDRVIYLKAVIMEAVVCLRTCAESWSDFLE